MVELVAVHIQESVVHSLLQVDLQASPLVLADACSVGVDNCPRIAVNKLIQQLQVPVIDDDVLVPADGTGTAGGDSTQANAGLSGSGRPLPLKT
jgi:hypothetical protein